MSNSLIIELRNIIIQTQKIKNKAEEIIKELERKEKEKTKKRW